MNHTKYVTTRDVSSKLISEIEDVEIISEEDSEIIRQKLLQGGFDSEDRGTHIAAYYPYPLEKDKSDCAYIWRTKEFWNWAIATPTDWNLSTFSDDGAKERILFVAVIDELFSM